MKLGTIALVVSMAVSACGDNMSLPDSPDATLIDGDSLPASIVMRLQQCPATKAHGTITKVCAVGPPTSDASGSLGDAIFNLAGTRDYRMIISPDVGDVLVAARAYVKAPVGVTLQIGILVDAVGTIPLSGSVQSNAIQDLAGNAAVQTIGGSFSLGSFSPVTVVAGRVYTLTIARVIGGVSASHVYQVEYDYRRPLP